MSAPSLHLVWLASLGGVTEFADNKAEGSEEKTKGLEVRAGLSEKTEG